VGALVVVALAVAVWGYFELRHARDAVTEADEALSRLRTAVVDRDDDARRKALDDFDDAARDAGGAGGPVWSLMKQMPAVGDDVTALQAVGRSLEGTSSALPHLLDAYDGLDEVTDGSRIDLDAVTGLRAPVAEALSGFGDARAGLADVLTSGLSSSVRTRVENYRTSLDSLVTWLDAGIDVIDVLPRVLGGEGERTYLMIVQNNAEIRATGGLPGSWSVVHAADGVLTMGEQGSAQDFTIYPEDAPVGDLTDEELAVYGPEIGRYFQDPGFTPDFPRAAEIFNAFWAAEHPDVPLDGVMALDPVTLGYVMEATGPVDVDGYELSADNVIQSLLQQVYLNLDPDRQDEFFEHAAKAVFDDVTADYPELTTLLDGLVRAGTEGRLLFAPFDPTVADAISGTRVAGDLVEEGEVLPEGQENVAHVDIGLNDATGSKMSYFLRYEADADVSWCVDDVQLITGSLTMSQDIDVETAALLPSYVTGGGKYGTEPGRQLVFVRLYGPVGGTIEEISINGRPEEITKVDQVNGRPVVNLAVDVFRAEDDRITWTMKAPPGQTDGVRLGITPSVIAGDGNVTVPSAC